MERYTVIMEAGAIYDRFTGSPVNGSINSF